MYNLLKKAFSDIKNLKSSKQTKTLTSSAQTHFVGTYNSVIYVNISKTAISVSKQPTGYTAELILYGR